MLKALCRVARWSLLSIVWLQTAHAYDCAKENGAMAFAAHSGRVDILQKHKQKGCKFRADERGFTLHDFATLSGETKAQTWLAQQKMDTKPSAALIRLVQAGLRQLGYDAGPVDGKLSARTEKAILAYQKKHKLKQNKQLKSAWLAHFYKNLMQKTQSALIQKGYKLGKADGQFGKETRKALIDYRSKQKLSPKQYAYLDDVIVRHLLSTHGTTTRPQKLATTKALAKNKVNEKQKSKQKITPKPTPTDAWQEDELPTNGIRLIRSNETTLPAAPTTTVAPLKIQAPEKSSHHEKSGVQSIRGNYRTISGRLSISGKQCQIGGQSIDSSWCQSYQDRNGRSCSAVIDNKGKVYNLLCK